MFGKNKKGISLIELILVITFAAILVVVVYAAILPGQRIGRANNALRLKDTDIIEKGIKTALINSTTAPAALTDITADTYYSLVISGGSTSGQYTCGELGQDIDRLDIASTIEPYISEMPIDPDISSGDDTGYYLVRRGDIFDVGYCNWYDAPILPDPPALPMGGGGGFTNYAITETDDTDFGAGTVSSEGTVSGSGDSASIAVSTNELTFDESSLSNFMYSPYDDTIWLSGSSKLVKIGMDGNEIAEYTTASRSTGQKCYDSYTNNIWAVGLNYDAIYKIDPSDGELLGAYSVGDGPRDIIFESYSNSLWVANYNAGTVSKVDPSDGGILNTYTVGTQPTELDFDSSTNSIWVLNYGSDSLSKISIDSGTINTYSPCITAGGDIVFDSSTNSIWLSDVSGGSLYKIDVSDGSTTGTYSYTSLDELVFDSSTNSIWAEDSFSDIVRKIDVSDGSTTSTYEDVLYVVDILFDDHSDAIWVASSNGLINKVSTSDATGLFGTRYALGSAPDQIEFDSSNGYIWLSDTIDDTLSKIDPSDGSIDDTHNLAFQPDGISYDSSTDSIWATRSGSDLVYKIRASDGQSLGSYSTGDAPWGVLFEAYTNSVWVANITDNTVSKFSASDGSLTGTYAAGTRPYKLTFDSSTNSVWVANNVLSGNGTVTKIAASDGSLTGTYDLGISDPARDVTFDSSTNSVWVAVGDYAAKVQASNGTVLGSVTDNTGQVMYGVTFDSTNDYIWALSAVQANKIDPSSISIVSKMMRPELSQGDIVFENSSNSVWVVSYSNDSLTKFPNSYYAYPVVFTSQILDTTVNTVFDTVSWNSTEPSGTSVSVKIRTSDSDTMSGATDWDSCTAIISGADISGNSCVTDTDKYIQYQVKLTSTDENVSPSFDDITINYSADSDTLSGPYCGDASCNGSETTANCYEDCGISCGDASCNGSETCSSCSADCGACSTNPPTISNAGRSPSNGASGQSANLTLSWTAWTDPDGETVEYQTTVYAGYYCTGSVVTTSSWTTSNTYPVSLSNSTQYSWKTKARGQTNQDESGHNYCYNFVTEAAGGTCPYLYSWDGEKWAFQTDTTAIGPLAFKVGQNPVPIKPRPLDVYVSDKIVPVNGEIELRIFSDLNEINYFDSQELYYYDVPEDMHVGVEQPALDSPYTAPYKDHIFASDPIKAKTAIRLDTGEDVADIIAERDGKKLVLNEDPDNFETKYIEFDFGDISEYAQKKLVIVANSAFPTTKEGLQKGKPGVSSVLYVLDENEEWQAVPYELVKPATPRPFERRMVVDISDIFLSDNTKLRMSYLYKTYIDQIAFDGTDDVLLSNPRHVRLLTAELSSYDLFHPVDKDGGQPNYYVTDKLTRQGYDGAYTKTGNVRELLTSEDDRFVVMAQGDEVVLKYKEPQRPIQDGYKRVYVLDTIGYHKAAKRSHTEMIVDPMPYMEMDNFPYTNSSPYSNDSEYQEYLDTWNTRICEEDFNYCYDSNTKETIKRQSLLR